jgi:hypothetical protein
MSSNAMLSPAIHLFALLVLAFAPKGPGEPARPAPTATASRTPPLLPSAPISLTNGSRVLANLRIVSDDKGIVGENDIRVTTLTVTNVQIVSLNYGIYLGSADDVILHGVDITASPRGGDSYSLRGAIKKLTSSDSAYRAGQKAFRVYGLRGGSSTRDLFSGENLMLGGGFADEWVAPGAFENFVFTDGRVRVSSVEIYDATHHVTFDGVDFAGTHHISIQAGAHHIVFAGCRNLPEIKYFDRKHDQVFPTPAQREARGMVVTTKRDARRP